MGRPYAACFIGTRSALRVRFLCQLSVAKPRILDNNRASRKLPWSPPPKMYRLIVLLILACCTVIAPVSAQTPEATEEPPVTDIPAEFAARAVRETPVRRGPGETYFQSDVLWRGAVGRVTERSSLGTWLRIVVPSSDPSLALDGWVWRGDLELDPAVRYSQIPVTWLHDADLDTITDPAWRDLYAPRIVSGVSNAMRDVFARGQELGINPAAVTKIGDSLSADPFYLNPMADVGGAVLGPYDHLQGTVAFFGPSLGGRYSVAARRGLTTYVVFDSMWSDVALCLPGESPLTCEYRIQRPAVSLIMFGPNDLIAMDVEEYEEQLRGIVEQSIAEGVIPVLSTFSFDPDHFRADESLAFNRVIVRLSGEYQTPLTNLFLATRNMPRYGLEGDFIHMRLSGFRNLQFDDALEVRFGGTLRNLLAVRMLDELRLTIPITPE